MGQVVPEIPRPHTGFQISNQIYTDLRDDQKSAKKRGILLIHGQFHCLFKPLIRQIFDVKCERASI